ncbi:MAG: hypothetical protein Q9186_006422 [Xanthomendoza sp. 1 TL-2023]
MTPWQEPLMIRRGRRKSPHIAQWDDPSTVIPRVWVMELAGAGVNGLVKAEVPGVAPQWRRQAPTALAYEVVQRGWEDEERGMDDLAGTDATLFEIHRGVFAFTIRL